MKNTLEGINSRLGDKEKYIPDLENRIMEIIISLYENSKKKKKKLNEKSLRDVWDNVKSTNIHTIGVPEVEKREKREKGKNVFDKIMAENFPNLKKKTDIQVQEAQRVPNKMNPNRPTARHVINMTKVKDREF